MFQESSNHVNHVIGVHRREYEWPVRRLNRDLRRLRVADFADHDFVRVVAQNRAQAAAKVNPFFSLTGICVMPRNWYSTGSSIVMILSSSVLISFTRRTASWFCALPVGPVPSTMP